MNQFNILPDDVLVLILSDINITSNQLLKLYNVEKRFKIVCEEHKIFDRYLLEAGFTIKEYNPLIISKALETFSRNTTGFITGDKRDLDYTKLYIDNDGNLVTIHSECNGNTYCWKKLRNIKNIISIVYTGVGVHALDSFGNVYYSKLVDSNNEKFLGGFEVVDHLKNIVCILDFSKTLFLDVYGNIFKYDDKPIVSGVVKRVFGSEIFLNKNGEIVFRRQQYTNNLDNINDKKYIFETPDKLLTVSEDNVVNITVDGNSIFNYKLNNNILRIDFSCHYNMLYILDVKRNLYIFNVISNVMETFENVVDFQTDDDDYVVLTSNGILYHNYDNNMTEKYVGTNVILFDIGIIMIDNKLYTTNIDDDELTLTLIPYSLA
jgi:hypothetical protein